ncbi:MAG: DUF3987 domain-containing protein [Bacteroidaceae bacterium]|nr:DUF3987 domain-containing protein [Bacteroidaceae bacterium]
MVLENQISIVKSVHNPDIQGVCTSGEQLEAYAEQNAALVARYRQGDSTAKLKMYGLIVGEHIEGKPLKRLDSCFRQGRSVMVDVDPPLPMSSEEVAQYIVGAFASVDIRGYCYLEESASGGVHGLMPNLFEGDAKKSLQLYQQMLPKLKLDMCVTNPSRICLLTGLKLAGTSFDNLFKEIPQSLIYGLKTMSSERDVAQDLSQAEDVEEEGTYEEEFDLLRAVTQELIEELGGFPQEGERNQFLYKAAAELRSITESAPCEVVRLLSEYQYFGLPAREAISTIRSACRKADEPKKSAMMRSSIDKAIQKSAAPKKVIRLSENCSVTVLAKESSADISSSVLKEVPPTPADEWTPFSEEPPAAIAFNKLPKFAQILVKNVPEWTYNHVWNGLDPALATYLCGTEARSIDGGEPIRVGEGFITVSVSGPSTGKSSRSPVFSAVTKKLRADDERNRAEMQAYNELSRRTKTADLPAKPVWTSQILGADCSSAALMMRLRSAKGALLINADELSMLSGLQSNTSDSNTPLLLAFSSERQIVDRSTDVAEAGAVNVRLNVAAHGTPYQFEKFAKNAYHSGLLSRMSLGCILPAGEFAGYGSYEGYQALIDPYVEKLCEAAGEMFQNKKIEDWALRMRREAERWGALYDSEPLLQFAARQSILAEKRAYIYWICNNRRWDAALENFMTYRFQFGLWCLMTAVAATVIAKELSEEQASTKGKKTGPTNWLASLSDSFSREDLATVRKLKDKPYDSKSVSKQISLWKSRSLIAPDPENPDRFIKL